MKPRAAKAPVMVVNLIGGGPVRFSDFCADNDLVLVVNEVNVKPVQYVAAIDTAVVAWNGQLVVAHGIGETPAKAVDNYRHKLNGHELVIDPASTFRREIQCPLVWKEDQN